MEITKKINNPDARVGVCCSHKVVAVGFNTLMLRRKRRGIKPSARIIILLTVFVFHLFFSQMITAAMEAAEIINKKQDLRNNTMELILVCHEKIQSDEEDKMINLSPAGIETAKQLGEKMRKQYSFDIAYTSYLQAADETLNHILNEMNRLDIPIHKSQVLSTITYKDLEGKNIFKNRNFEYHIEKLKSYWISTISASLKEKKNVLIVTDENTIRILIKHLLNMPDEKVLNVYIPTDNSFYFEMNENLDVLSAAFPLWEMLPERIDEF